MATRRTPYVYGSAAPNIEVMPRREDDYERRRQTRPVSRPRPKRKAKIDKVAVLLTALTFFVVMAAGIFYLRLQFQSTYLNKSVVKLQSEVVEMEKKNATAEKELDDSVDLTAIYNKATRICRPGRPKRRRSSCGITSAPPMVPSPPAISTRSSCIFTITTKQTA